MIDNKYQGELVSTDLLRDIEKEATPTDQPIGTGMLLAGAGVTITRAEDTKALTVALADNGVTTTQVKDGAITTDKLADNAVEADNIADGTIVTGKLTDSAVSELKAVPAATTSALGGVKMAPNVTDLKSDATLAQVIASYNGLLANLRSAGIMNS